MQRICVTVALLLAPTIALSADWVTVAEGDGVAVYVDQSSLRRTGNRVKAWIMWTYSTPKEVSGSYPKKTYHSRKALQIEDCASNTYALAQSTSYADGDGAGEVVSSITIPELQRSYSEHAPETIGEAIHDFSCRSTRNQGGA